MNRRIAEKQKGRERHGTTRPSMHNGHHLQMLRINIDQPVSLKTTGLFLTSQGINID